MKYFTNWNLEGRSANAKTFFDNCSVSTSKNVTLRISESSKKHQNSKTIIKYLYNFQ